MTISATSPRRLADKAKPFQIRLDRLVQPPTFVHLIAKRGGQPPHLPLERLAVVLCGLGAYVASRRQHVVMLADLVERHASAKAGHIGVIARLWLSAPSVVRPSDARDVVVREIPVSSVDHRAQFAGVDKQDLPAAVAELRIASAAGEEPEACGYLSRVKELAGQRDHAVDEVCLDDVLSDLALAG